MAVVGHIISFVLALVYASLTSDSFYCTSVEPLFLLLQYVKVEMNLNYYF